jgi:hypothetical protein
MAGMRPLRQTIKVFCFFSSEKKTFLALIGPGGTLVWLKFPLPPWL